MIQTVISSLAVFMSTSVDDLLILTIMFSRIKTKRGIAHIVGGQYLGTAALVIGSLVAAYVIHLVPETWMIGFLGLVPIALGIRAATQRNLDDDEAESKDVAEKLEEKHESRLFWTIALITVAAGGDNVGIYIPYFASLSAGPTALALAVLTMALAALCYAGYKISALKLIAQTLEKYERIMVPIVFIALGVFILLDAGTVARILQAIRV